LLVIRLSVLALGDLIRTIVVMVMTLCEQVRVLTIYTTKFQSTAVCAALVSSTHCLIFPHQNVAIINMPLHNPVDDEDESDAAWEGRKREKVEWERQLVGKKFVEAESTEEPGVRSF